MKVGLGHVLRVSSSNPGKKIFTQAGHVLRVKKFFFDPIIKEYLLVGLAGKEEIPNFAFLPPKE